MDKPSRVSGLIFLAGALNHGLDLSDPLTAEGRYDESLTSFAAFKADLVMLLAAGILFVTHWRWLRRLPESTHA